MGGKVINIKSDETFDVYIGRRQWRGKEVFLASPWANYFSVKRYGRDEAIRRYEEQIRNTHKLWVRFV